METSGDEAPAPRRRALLPGFSGPVADQDRAPRRANAICLGGRPMY